MTNAGETDAPVSFANSAALQFRSVKSLMLRRFRTRYVGSRAGYAWALVEPLLWVFVLKIALGHGGKPPLGESFEVFFATGVILVRGWRTGAVTTAQGVTRAMRMTLPAIHRLDSAYAVLLLEAATTASAMLLILSIFGVFGLHVAPDDLLDCLAAFGATALFTLGFGLTLAVILTVMPAFQHFQGILMMVMFMSSGFAMLVDRAPPAVRRILEWNPLVHCVEWFREGFYPNYDCFTLDKEYLFTVTAALLLFGLAGERALRRHSPRGKV